MGKVYLAQGNHLQGKIAIEELTYFSTYRANSQVQSQVKYESVNHTLQEARILARVNHKNIIQICNISLRKNNRVFKICCSYLLNNQLIFYGPSSVLELTIQLTGIMLRLLRRDQIAY